MPLCLRALPLHRSPASAFIASTLAFLCSTDGEAGTKAKLDSSVEHDNYDLATTRFEAEVGQGDDDLAWRLRGRWFSYSLDRDLVGIHPFSGSEPALELGAHGLAGSWWFAGTGGVQGTLSGADVIGNAVVARAFTWDARTLTPRVSAGRQPLALSALPLSLGMRGTMAEAGLAWRSPDWMGELVTRIDWSSTMTVEGRVENPALATIPGNRRMLASAYMISQGGWLQGGVSAKVQNGHRNTLVATQITPDYAYTWYPISMPLWAWETAVIARATGHLLPSLQALLQIQLPLLSRELRRWETVEQWAWGTAAWEAKAELQWHMTRTTQLSFGGLVFAKPWAHWNVGGEGGYRQLALQAGITQRL